MARLALAMSPAGHPAELGPCARPRFTADQVREALEAAGHQVVEAAGPADLRVVDVAAEEVPETGDPSASPLVLISLGRPVDPWHAVADPGERQAFIDPWGIDLERRRRAALPRRASAYADSLADLRAAIHEALAPAAPPGPPALSYRGALFNSCALRPGAAFALGAEPRPFVLGRGVTADVQVMSPNLARAHLELVEVADQTLQLTDLGSTNGTWLLQADGEVVALRAGVPVRAGAGALIMPEGSFRFLVV